MIPRNLFADFPAELPQELFETLAASDAVRIERIVSHGHSSPEGFWFDQDRNEFVVLLAGAARLRFEDGGPAVEMKAGDYILIPAHCRHRVEWTTADEATIWLAVHFGTHGAPPEATTTTAATGTNPPHQAPTEPWTTW